MASIFQQRKAQVAPGFREQVHPSTSDSETADPSLQIDPQDMAAPTGAPGAPPADPRRFASGPAQAPQAPAPQLQQQPVPPVPQPDIAPPSMPSSPDYQFRDPQLATNIGQGFKQANPGPVRVPDMELKAPMPAQMPVGQELTPDKSIAATPMSNAPSPTTDGQPQQSPWMSGLERRFKEIDDLSDQFKQGATNIKQWRDEQANPTAPVSKGRRIASILAGIGEGFMAKNPMAGIETARNVAHPEIAHNEYRIKGQTEANTATMDQLKAKQDELSAYRAYGPKPTIIDAPDPNNADRMIKKVVDENALIRGENPDMGLLKGSGTAYGEMNRSSTAEYGADVIHFLQAQMEQYGPQSEVGQESARLIGTVNPKQWYTTGTGKKTGAIHAVYPTGAKGVSTYDTKDEKSKTGWSRVTEDERHNEIGRSDVTPKSSEESTVVRNGVTYKEVRNGDGTITQTPMPTQSTSTRTAGGPAEGKTAPAAATPNQAVPGGVSSAKEKINLESGELTEQGKKQLTELRGTTPLFDKLMRHIDKLGLREDGMPFQNAIARIGYKLGFASDPESLAGEISNLELAKITGAMPYTKSRNYQYIQAVQEHLPKVAEDSPKLMFDKLVKARRQFNTYAAATLKTETKHAQAGSEGEALMDKSALDFYMLAAKNDKKKALQMAKEDGWTGMEANATAK